MSVKARHVQSLFCWVPWWRLLLLFLQYVSTVSFSRKWKWTSFPHYQCTCHYHTLSLLFMYLFPCLHQRIWSSCIVCILRLHALCKECSELQPHGVLFLDQLLAKTSIGLVDPFMHLLVIPGVQFRCARYKRTPTTEHADHFSDVTTRKFVHVHGHNVPSDVSLKKMFCNQLSVCCHCQRIKHT